MSSQMEKFVDSLQTLQLQGIAVMSRLDAEGKRTQRHIMKLEEELSWLRKEVQQSREASTNTEIKKESEHAALAGSSKRGRVIKVCWFSHEHKKHPSFIG